MKRSSAFHLVWISGLVILFATLAAFKIQEAQVNEYYFIMVLAGLAVFYMGAFLSINKPYSRSWKYIKESRGYIYSVITIFVLFAIFGFLFSKNLSFLEEVLKGVLERTEGLGTPEMIDFIFFNNLEVSFLGLFLGVFLGIFPLINTVTNGAVLGYVFSKLAAVSRLNEFWRIFPHGVFELPAVFISLALGIKLGMFIFGKDKAFEFRRRIKESIVVFVFYVLPLLAVAAVIEGVLIGLLN